MKYPQSEKQGSLKISKHLIYSKGYGCMAQTILSIPIRPPWEFVKCCVPTVGYLSSKLYTGLGNLSFMNLFFSTTFILKNPRYLKNA